MTKPAGAGMTKAEIAKVLLNIKATPGWSVEKWTEVRDGGPRGRYMVIAYCASNGWRYHCYYPDEWERARDTGSAA